MHALEKKSSEIVYLGEWQVILVRDSKAVDDLEIDRRGGALGIYEINNSSTFYGVIVMEPKSVISSLTLKNNSTKASFQLDVSDMYSPFLLPRENAERFYTINCETNSSCVFRGFFGYAALGYIAEWRIENEYSRRSKIVDVRSPKAFTEMIESMGL